eukprot:scaffold95982_cov69-Phaeocystis_antarctica.AAC.1
MLQPVSHEKRRFPARLSVLERLLVGNGLCPLIFLDTPLITEVQGAPTCPRRPRGSAEGGQASGGAW